MSGDTLRTAPASLRVIALAVQKGGTGKTTPPPSPRTGLYARQLAALSVLAEPAMIPRVDHQDALALGAGVTEQVPGGLAAEEIRTLWAWLARRIGR